MIFELMLGDLFVESNLMQKCFWLLWEAHERINSSQYIPYNFMQKVVYIKFVRETQKKKGRENIKCCWIPFVKATRLQIEIILREEMDYVEQCLMNSIRMS